MRLPSANLDHRAQAKVGRSRQPARGRARASSAKGLTQRAWRELLRSLSAQSISSSCVPTRTLLCTDWYGHAAINPGNAAGSHAARLLLLALGSPVLT